MRGHPVPRLIKSMMYVACLSESEAVHAIQMHWQGMSGPDFGTEAVVHFGGPLVVIRAAIDRRTTRGRVNSALRHFNLKEI